MARGSGCTLVIRDSDVPLFSEAASLARDGYVTGASRRNWASYGDAVTLPPDMPEWRRHLLTDPQTSGGLLIACAHDSAAALVEKIIAGNYPLAHLVGHVEPGLPGVTVLA